MFAPKRETAAYSTKPAISSPNTETPSTTRGPFDSLGYKQARAVLRGEMTLPEAIASAQQGHRNYAKRQLTWFRREPDVLWLRGFGDDPAITAHAVAAVAETLP